MALTKKQLSEILQAIEDRFLELRLNTLGNKALSKKEIRRLQKMGLLKTNVKGMVVDANNFGKLTAILPPSKRAKISYSDLQKLVDKITIKRTPIEEKAIEYATESVGAHIQGLKDSMLKETKSLSAAAGMTAIRRVQEEVVSNIVNRETVSQLKTNLYHAFDNKHRDWYRVAQTEINNTIQHAIHSKIVEDHGKDQLVYKRPNPDCCVHCRRLCLEGDGITPKIFKVNELADSNFGKKAVDWEVTVGSLHPFCQCQLFPYTEGYSFKKVSVAKEPFKIGKKEFKVGEIIPTAILKKPSVSERIKETAILMRDEE